VIVLDTNALVFWTLDRDKLTHAAMTAIEEEERLKRVEGLRILPVDDRTWLRNVELDWSHRDPADRTIVATAMLDSSPLVTSDATIRSFYQRAIW